jgi:hypothetical protein
VDYELRVIDRTLVYPPHGALPEDFGYFIENQDFTNVWRLKGFTDDDLIFLQACLMLDPSAHKPMVEIGDICFAEFRCPDRRILFWYKYMQDVSTIYLIAADPEDPEEGEIDVKISPENKALLQKYAAILEAELRIPRKT